MRSRRDFHRFAWVPAIGLLMSSTLAADSKPFVLVDESHGQRFLIDGMGPLQLSQLASVLTEAGVEVNSSKEPLTLEGLSRSDALVISGPFQALIPKEIEAVLEWLEDGGRLAVMLHVGPPVAGLLHRLGVSISNGVIRETEGVIGDDAINFAVSRLQEHTLFAGLESFNIFGAWALLVHGHHAEGIAETGRFSWVDLDRDRAFSQGDAAQRFAVAVEGTYGRGRFVIFGDDAMFQNRFLIDDNRRLAANLANWMKEPSSQSKPLETAP